MKTGKRESVRFDTVGAWTIGDIEMKSGEKGPFGLMSVKPFSSLDIGQIPLMVQLNKECSVHSSHSLHSSKTNLPIHTAL